jgi:hypothetical protein
MSNRDKTEILARAPTELATFLQTGLAFAVRERGKWIAAAQDNEEQLLLPERQHLSVSLLGPSTPWRYFPFRLAWGSTSIPFGISPRQKYL